MRRLTTAIQLPSLRMWCQFLRFFCWRHQRWHWCWRFGTNRKQACFYPCFYPRPGKIGARLASMARKPERSIGLRWGAKIGSACIVGI
jgi:hypothetical protein